MSKELNGNLDKLEDIALSSSDIFNGCLAVNGEEKDIRRKIYNKLSKKDLIELLIKEQDSKVNIAMTTMPDYSKYPWYNPSNPENPSGKHEITCEYTTASIDSQHCYTK